jgi:hypothetical protein
MRKSRLDTRPDALEKAITGVHIFRWDIEEKTEQTQEGETRTYFEFYELYVENGSRVNTVEAAIAALWGDGVEQKLQNDYAAAKEGIFIGEKAAEAIAAYKEFLNERISLKQKATQAYENYQGEE